MFIACLNRNTGCIQYNGGVVDIDQRHAQKQEDYCLNEALKVPTSSKQRILSIIKMRDLTQCRPWLLTIPAEYAHDKPNLENPAFTKSLSMHFRAFSMRWTAIAAATGDFHGMQARPRMTFVAAKNATTSLCVKLYQGERDSVARNAQQVGSGRRIKGHSSHGKEKSIEKTQSVSSIATSSLLRWHSNGSQQTEWSMFSTPKPMRPTR